MAELDGPFARHLKVRLVHPHDDGGECPENPVLYFHMVEFPNSPIPIVVTIIAPKGGVLITGRFETDDPGAKMAELDAALAASIDQAEAMLSLDDELSAILGDAIIPPSMGEEDGEPFA